MLGNKGVSPDGPYFSQYSESLYSELYFSLTRLHIQLPLDQLAADDITSRQRVILTLPCDNALPLEAVKSKEQTEQSM